MAQLVKSPDTGLGNSGTRPFDQQVWYQQDVREGLKDTAYGSIYYDTYYGYGHAKTAGMVVSIPRDVAGHNLKTRDSKDVLRDALSGASLASSIGTLIPGVGSALGSAVGAALGLVSALTKDDRVKVSEFLQGGVYGIFDSLKNKDFIDLKAIKKRHFEDNEYYVALEFNGLEIIDGGKREFTPEMAAVIFKGFSDAIRKKAGSFKQSNDASDIERTLSGMRIDTYEDYNNNKATRSRILGISGSPLMPFVGGTVDQINSGQVQLHPQQQSVNSRPDGAGGSLILPLAGAGILAAILLSK